MADWTAHGNTIRTRYKTEITDKISSPPSTGLGYALPTQHDNQGSKGFSKPTTKAPWARASILWGDSIQQSIGTPNSHRYRTVGTFQIQVFVPLEEGDKRLREIGKFIGDAFRSWKSGDLQFRTPSLNITGRDRDGGWWQGVLSCPFYVDDIEATAT